MNRSRIAPGILFIVTIAPLVLGLVAAPAGAAAKCRGKCDREAPTVAIQTPTANATVSGGVTVAGSSSDGVAVQSVSVSVDGGPWATASGTGSWSWSWSTAAMSDGMHTVVAKAVDTSGNAASTSVGVNVANGTTDTTAPSVAFSAPTSGATVSSTVAVSGSAGDNGSVAKVEVRVDSGTWQPAVGTGSWSWSWDTTGVADGSHTLAARATDSAGNATSTTRSVTVANSTSTSTPPDATGTWTSPEGVSIDIQTSTGSWTHERIYSMLTAGARDLSKIGPGLKIVVQDSKPTLSSIAASSVDGRYTSVSATIQLDARSTSTFATRPDDILTHEYGHVWFNYYGYLKWQGDWSAYLGKRWTGSDGSTTLATDARTGSSYIWTPDEIAADDYRLLFGSDAAIAQRNASLNQQIPDPRSQAGLRDWLLSTWAG